MTDFDILVDINFVRATGAPASLLNTVSFTIKKGDRIGIIGDSGAGKSSLAKLISNTAPPDWNISGTLTRSEPNIFILYLQQDPGSAFPPYLTIREIWTQICSSRPNEADGRFLALLPRLSLDSLLLDSFPGQLSGGEKQRFLFAMSIAVKPDILILDEPTASLDPETKNMMLQVIETLAEEFTCMIISHDIPVLERICTRILILDGGRLIDSIRIEKNKILSSMLSHPHSKLLLKSWQVAVIKNTPTKTEGIR